MNTAAKGRRAEYKSIALFEAAGYQCIRAAASKGPFDIWAVSRTDIVFCQTKAGAAWPSPAERETLASFPAPPNARRLIHRWRARQRQPDVMEL